MYINHSKEETAKILGDSMRLVNAELLDGVSGQVPDGMDAESYMAGMEYVLDKLDALPTKASNCDICVYYDKVHQRCLHRHGLRTSWLNKYQNFCCFWEGKVK